MFAMLVEVSEAEDTYTTGQAARILKVTDRGVRKMIDRGELEARRDERGRHLIPQRAAHAVLEGRLAPLQSLRRRPPGLQKRPASCGRGCRTFSASSMAPLGQAARTGAEPKDRLYGGCARPPAAPILGEL